MQEQSSPFFSLRTVVAFALLALIAINMATAAAGVVRCRGFFLQPRAQTFVSELIGALLVYAVAIVFIARTRGPYWDSILRTAMFFGVLTGAVEITNIALENGIPLAIRGPVPSIGLMLIIFTSWAIAGFRTACSLRSTSAGLLAALLSASICMLIAVAAGFMVQFFLAPPQPAYVSTWAEFKRSGWTDARAFGVASTLDSGFTHLVIAPVAALLFGGPVSLLGRFASESKPSLNRYRA